MKSVLFVALAVLVIGGIAVFLLFSRDIAVAKDRATGRSRVIDTSFGPLEYAQRGDGPPFLMIHGTGGGFDQGLTFTE